jgi:two-component system nitrogen regulation sensor histidine kinase GlnL
MLNLRSKANQLLENLYTAIVVIDSNMCITTMNTAAETMLSMSIRKAAGLRADMLLPRSQRFLEIVRRSLESRQPFTERGVELLLPITGSVFVDCMVTPVFDKSHRDQCQEIIVEMVNANSITRFVREESLSLLHNAARETLRGMAHEIKNPLGGLRGAAQLLERELNGNELTEYTNIIISEADRLSKLVDRMITPDGSVNITEVNIHEVLEYVQQLITAESTSPLNIDRDYDPSLPDLDADREQLIQAFLNILRNAVQAAGAGGRIWINTRIKRKCTIRQRIYKLGVQIEIIDDGPGVPKELENSIFYPLVTGRADGTGLGLSISQSLIQAHGGIIEHERCDNRTYFRILLPIRSRDE